MIPVEACVINIKELEVSVDTYFSSKYIDFGDIQKTQKNDFYVTHRMLGDNGILFTLTNQ